MTDALVKGTGNKGELLAAAFACERGEFPSTQLAQIQLEAMSWATAAAEELFEQAPAVVAA